MNPILRSFLIVFLTVCSMVLVVMAIALPLGGHSTGYVSDLYYSSLTPAGWAFSIWSVIYTGLIAFAIWQALPAQRDSASLSTAAPYIMGILIANGAWLPAWHYVQLPLSLGIIAVYLFCAVKTMDVFATEKKNLKGAAYWLCFVLFSIYAGWLTIATVANATVVALASGIHFGLSADAWAVLLLCIAFAIAYLMFMRWQSPAYFLVITWAYIAIASAHKTQWTVYTTALILAGLAASVSVKTIFSTVTANRKAQ